MKTNTADIRESPYITALRTVLRKFPGIIGAIGNIKIFSDDTVYRWIFIKKYVPDLYNRHTRSRYANCVFCSNLKRSGFRGNLYKCSAGTYIHGSPLLPGSLCTGECYLPGPEVPGIPWYYKKTCGSFTRLPRSNYLRNFGFALSSEGIYNFEVLEGLEKGLSGGERPCHVCASADYGIYKACSSRKNFNKYSPCRDIAGVLSDFYRRQ